MKRWHLRSARRKDDGQVLDEPFVSSYLEKTYAHKTDTAGRRPQRQAAAQSQSRLYQAMALDSATSSSSLDSGDDASHVNLVNGPQNEMSGVFEDVNNPATSTRATTTHQATSPHITSIKNPK